MSADLDELYLTWLYGEIANPETVNPSRTYWKLARQLYTTEFRPFIPHDENRADDGRQLRVEFSEELGLTIEDPHWMYLGCSMLEMFIGLSRRLSFSDEGEPRDWFWHLIENLDLCFADRQRFPTHLVEEVLDRINQRTYNSDGSGGLFPLHFPTRDQRRVELWSQLNAYLLERI